MAGVRVRGGVLRGIALLGLGVVGAPGCEEVVVESLPVARIEISPASITLLEGEEVRVSAVLRGPGGEVLGGRTVRWSAGTSGVVDLPPGGTVLGVAPGTTELRAWSDGVEATAPVTVLQGPVPGLSTPAVALAGRRGTDAEAETTVEVTNAGNGVLSALFAEVAYADSRSVDWLEVALSSPTAPSELRLRARFDAMTPGTHRATVQVGSPVARSGPRGVEVTVQLLDALPSIGLSPVSLAFAANAGSFEPASQAVQVSNQGGGTLESLQVRILREGGTTVHWLTAALDRSRAPATLELEASARMLAAGTYRARVRVSSTVAEPATRELEVTFTVSTGGMVRGKESAAWGVHPHGFGDLAWPSRDPGLPARAFGGSW